MLLGGFYAELATDLKYKDLAIKKFDRASELSPNRQHIYFNLGRLYTVLGERDNIILTFKKAINLDSGVATSYWEGARQLFILDPNDKQGEEWLYRALNLGLMPNDTGEFLFIFNKMHSRFLKEQNYNILSSFYERMQEIEPKEAKWYAQGATTYYMLKEYEAALSNIKKAIEIDESYREDGQEFIRVIKNTQQ